MNKYVNIEKEIDQLVLQGTEMYDCLLKYANKEEPSDLNPFINNYEVWYTKALLLVKQILPQRYDDFKLKYRDDKRKQLTSSTYTILDGLNLVENKARSVFISRATMPLLQQIEIVKSCKLSFESQIYNMQLLLQADIFDSEIDSAKHLLKMGFLRASGAICGVVIEKHFKSISEKHKIVIKKKSPCISDYNDAFKDNIYDTLEWRRIQRLGDIRNLCDHSKDREPTKDEVEELISGTERITKTIF